MTMNLDVDVRLIDGVTRPSRDATEAVERFGAAAQRIARRVAGLAGASNSFASAVRDLRAADTALDRAAASGGRLRGTMAGIGPAARASAAGLGIATRAIERYASATSRAATATDRLRTGIERPTAESFVDRANTALREQVRLLNDAARLSNRLANAGGNGRGGRRGMGGGNGGGHVPGSGLALAYDVPALGVVARKAIEVSITAEDAILRARLNGFTESQIDKIKATAQKVANDNRSTTYAGNVKGLIEARLALAGDLDRAVKLFPKAADFGVIFAKMGGEADKAEAATKGIYAAFRSGELRNIVGDDARLDSMFRGMMASSIVSEGKIGPQQFASNIQYARSAGLALSDSFTNFTLPFLMQELQNAGKGSRGGQAGNALMSGYSAVVQGRIAHGKEWVDAGELDASDLDERGKLKPDAHPKDMAMFMSDPLAFFQKLMKNFESRGITSQNDKLAHISAMFDNRVAAGLADLLSLQDSRIESARAMYMQAGGDTPGSEQQKLALINATLGQSTENLNNAFTDLRVTAMAPFMGMMTETTQVTNSALKTTQGLLSRFTGIGSDPNDPKSTGTNVAGIALSAGSLAFLAAKFLAKFPRASTFVGQIGVGAATQSPIAGVLSKSIVKGMVEGINTGLSSVRGAGILRGLGRGIWMGMLEQAGEFGIDKLVDLLPKKDLGARQGAFDANRREWNQAAIWEKPSLIWKDIVGGRAGDEPTPGTVAPYGGARARGGSVLRGMSYLVGERGPEIFTPGQPGGIATNRATRGLMSGVGGDDAMPRAIRYLSFALVSAIDALTRAVDRGNRRDRIGDGDGGSSNNEGVSGAGTGSHISGGRRGFAARGGHFGGRRGFATRQFGTRDESLPDTANTGPHVGLGRMAGGRSRGTFAKFDSKAPAIMGALMTKYGLTKEQAAGVVGNLAHESARFTAYHEGGKASASGGVGWAQWTGSRRHAFERWTAAHGLNPTSDEASWRFLTEGDPETAGAMAAVKKTHTADAAVRAFHDHFERSADIDRGGNIVKWKNWNSRLDLAHRAGGMNPVAGTPDPADRVPEVLREQAKQQQAERESRSKNEAKGGDTHHHHKNHVAINVHPAPGHDPRQIASAVHEHFNRAVNTQLNDGAFA